MHHRKTNPSLPFDINLDIVSRLSKLDFKLLAPLICSGKIGQGFAFHKSVLEVANLDEFLHEGYKVGLESIYRPFFHRCFMAGNGTACLMKALRIAFETTKVKRAINILRGIEKPSKYTIFALGMLFVCYGKYEKGVNALKPLEWWKDLPAATHISQVLIQSIGTMNIRRRAVDACVMELDIPECEWDLDEMETCVECFVQFHATEFCALS